MSEQEYKQSRFFNAFKQYWLIKLVIAVLLFALSAVFVTLEILMFVDVVLFFGAFGALLFPRNGNIRKSSDGEKRFGLFLIIEILGFTGTIAVMIARKAIIKKNRSCNIFSYKEIASGQVTEEVELEAISAKNPSECLDMLTAAADLGSIKALELMAFGYSDAANESLDGNMRFGYNPEKEEELLHKAASLGSTGAMMSLALNASIKHNFEEAINMFREVVNSANAKNSEKAEAFYNMAECYTRPYLGKPEPKEAVEKAVACLELPLLRTKYYPNKDIISSYKMMSVDERSEYDNLREYLSSCAMSLATNYKILYKDDPSMGNKIAGMYIYASILNSRHDVKDLVKDLSYNFSQEQLDIQRKAAMQLVYTLA